MNWLIIFSTLLLAILISAAIYFQQNGAVSIPLKPAQPTLLLVGPSSSGKTCLFQRLLFDRNFSISYTSQRTNSGRFQLDNGKTIKIMDVPGHPKLFGDFKTYRPTSIVFVLDSSTLSKNASSVVQNLLEVLNFARKQNIKEVGLFANKEDLFTALSPEKVKELIESEVEQVRKQKEGVSMESIEEKSEENDEWLQDITGAFDLSNECTLLHGSVLKGSVESLKSWISSIYE